VTGGAPAPPALTVDDILDLRAYERVREDYRRRIMARKRLRRVGVGPITTLLFECLDTVRFQVQEMARVERISTDEGIRAELEVYNRLLPQPGELSATLFIELTTEEDLRRWLPALVGIERAVGIELAPGEGRPTVRSEPETSHADSLTRDAVTPAVHYLRFAFTDEEVARFAAGPVAVVVDHPAYAARTELAEPTRQELLADLQGRTVPVALA
jgi:hypothetical protein